MRKKNTVIKKFLNKRIKGNVLTIHGDGTQKRDFIHVDDVCEFIWLALNYDDRIFEPIDIGTGIATSMIDLAKKFAHSYAFTDSRNVGAQSSVANTSKAKELFGYQAKDKIREYIDTRPDLLS
jgi:UDP-glucose 4-epimerase